MRAPVFEMPEIVGPWMHCQDGAWVNMRLALAVLPLSDRVVVQVKGGQALVRSFSERRPEDAIGFAKALVELLAAVP